MKISEDRRKILKIVTMYYEQGLTQAMIAKEMRISRPVVSKILHQARESGIVSVSIKDESAYAVALALRLERKYQLSDVIVIPTNEQKKSETIQKEVSRAAAYYFKDRLTADMSVGLSWGTTLADMIDEMPYCSFPTMNVCPLVGGISSEHLYFDTNHLVFRLAEKIYSRCQYFYAPALAESIELANVLNKSQLVGRAMAQAKNVDFAIIGVGNPIESSTWMRLGYIETEELQVIKETGVKGDAVASLFDKNGKTVNNEISKRMLGVKVEDLMEIPDVMVIGCGVEKAESIKPLLLGNCLTILVIDQTIAEALV
ncbi:sugar-binding protein [Enterococcus ureilyticus]|uniref:Sugar-binding protein n=1 Tax=Enterococcus ureilyticus TaxID=1131292 RepID=A0A1E5H9W3_9ENTE|nr:sugar-binding domain-containing protein [Enterococcus ureilyticus]MBM7688353.1 DNA-binding transcriptional regulator LsrR (DeoR family) [Enterococcus ureilyticus]MBO0445019.1 sugar-binding transcriptional regulator [Enterococcus ureilyticus]OEG21714.1 sugar-binding protein [Enterococcus ureilyticus]